MATSPLWRPAPFVTTYMVDREDKRTNNRAMLPTLKNNAAAGHPGPVKIELLKGPGLLSSLGCSQFILQQRFENKERGVGQPN